MSKNPTRCIFCDRPIKGESKMVEMDLRTCELFAEEGHVPAEFSQGWFEIGPRCHYVIAVRNRLGIVVEAHSGPAR